MELTRSALLFDKVKNTTLKSNSFALKESPVVLFGAGLDADMNVQVLVPDTNNWVNVVRNGTALVVGPTNTRVVLGVTGTYRVDGSAAAGAIEFCEFEVSRSGRQPMGVRKGTLVSTAAVPSNKFEVLESPVVLTGDGAPAAVEMRVRAIDVWGPVIVDGVAVSVSPNDTHFVISVPGDYRVNGVGSTVYYRESELDGEFSFPTVDELLNLGGSKSSGGSGTDSQTLSLAGTTLSISNGNSVDLASAVKSGETLTALMAGSGATIVYTDEAGVVNTIDLSSVIKAGETITILGTPTWDSVTGLLTISYTDEAGVVNSKTCTVMPTFVNTDNQQLTGDTAGTVQLTLTPAVVGGVTNYTVKADLKVAAATPTGGVNQLKLDAAGSYYVDAPTVATQKSDVVTATAGQTSFTLSSTPTGSVYGFRNGVFIPTGFAFSGTAVTYTPANNGGKAIDAGDIISFAYEA